MANNQKWHTIAVAWQQNDKNGKPYIKVMLNETLRKGEALFLRPNNKRPGKKDPDYQYYVRKGCYDPKECEVLAEPKHSDDISDDIPF